MGRMGDNASASHSPTHGIRKLLLAACLGGDAHRPRLQNLMDVEVERSSISPPEGIANQSLDFADGLPGIVQTGFDVCSIGTGIADIPNR